MSQLRQLFSPSLALALALLAACATMQQQGAFNRAQIAFDAGDYRTALQHLDRATTYESPSPAALAEIEFLRARCLDAQNNRTAAIAGYDSFLKKFPASPHAANARARLAELQSK
ncbi:MAG: tetratricopeptide repeat protein [Verrucomicrobia bacterium]|nr:tetratricopeptide repeat protein [Verrucomicrobiota bacterium]